MLKLWIDNRIRVRASSLDRSVLSELKQEFEHSNPTYWKLKSRGFWPGKEPAVIRTWENISGILSFPRGGYGKVKTILNSHGIQYTMVDLRQPGSFTDTLKFDWTLFDYQARCQEAAIAKENCIIKAPTGSGKTILGVSIISELQVPTLVVVNAEALAKQWVERIENSCSNPEIGIIQGSKFKLKPVTIGMAQSLYRCSEEKWAKINSYFGCVIQDEVQIAAAKSFMDVIDKCTAKHRIGLSADHTRKDKKEFLIYDLFGKVAAEVTREELVERKFVLDVEVLLDPTEFTADWYVLQRKAMGLRDQGLSANEVYYTLKQDFPDLEPDQVPLGQPDFSRLVGEMCDDPFRNQKILSLTERFVLDGHKVFVLTSRVDHCGFLVQELSRRGIKAGKLIGGPENRDEFDNTIESLQTGDTMVGVGTWHALGTGIDCPVVSRGIMATPINGKQIFSQIRGRFCRTAPGKKDAKLYYLYDQNVFGIQPVKNMNQWNTMSSVITPKGTIETSVYLKR